jgi:hypothetical protein
MGGQLCRTGIWTLGLLIILRCGRADDVSSSSAIAQTVQHAANNPQIANTNAKTVGGSATAASGADLPAAVPTLQTSDVNKALTTASQVATQILQNAPPAPKCEPLANLAVWDLARSACVTPSQALPVTLQQHGSRELTFAELLSRIRE